ncbi:MAG: ROK family protein [Promethearchaeota archaeon]|nr:MAG: ROK family protein [Candidatus Lokiarchaeota archaeon]
MDEKFIVGVDIGGTWIRVAICTPDLIDKNIKIKITETLKENKYSISNSVVKLLSALLSENDIKNEQIIGIGLAMAGPIDIIKGEGFNNPNLGFRIIPLKGPIEEKFPGIPIYLINDCNAAVLGVQYFEADDDEKENLVYITVSTGVGGGAICNGHLLLGKEGNAVEIGHGIVEPKSTIQCNCGAYGCWEVYSSGTGVKLRTLNALNDGELNADILLGIVNGNKSKITAKEVFQAAREGDILSKKIVDECIFYCKVGIGLINNYYDVSTIYFGGAMIKDEMQIIPPLIEQFEKDPIKFTINHPPKIKITKYRDEIGVRGALTLVKYKSENNPILEGTSF